MNMTSRQMYYDSPFAQSTGQIYTRKNRMLASTGFNLNNSTNSGRLPQLSRSFSSSKSAKLKLTTIEGTLSSISQQIHQLKTDTRESRRYCNYLKDDLGQNHLGTVRLELNTQINKLQKMFKLSKKHDEDRTKALKLDSDKLKESSANIKSLMNNLQTRLDNCQNIMGVYSGKEKHKI